MLWRLVVNEPQIATLTELQTTWSLLDVAKANDALEAIAEARELQAREHERRMKERG